jgi:hypothetical protein
MNKPNKSIIAMRKAGLVKATAFTEEQQQIANDYVIRAFLLCESRKESTFFELDQSYLLGLKGIRIGQEASHG